MSRSIHASLACVSVGSLVAGCASSPVQTAGNVAGSGAHAIYTTGGDVYSGVGAAARQPFRDLNIMQDPIPPVLLKAEARPYDLGGVTSCEALTNQVAELDLALGPDLDSPKDRGRDRFSKGADEAASAALEAATSAAEGFLPMRSIIKRVSGAKRYEDHVKHAVLSGTVRRSFLKAIGMEHNCGWPAEPLGFDAASMASISGRWAALGGDQPAVQTASAAAPQPGAPDGRASQTVAVAAAVSPAHPDVQAVAVSTSTSGGAPLTHVYMVANPAAGRAGAARTVTVSGLAPAANGAPSAQTIKVSGPTARSGSMVATATVAARGRGTQSVTVTTPSSAPGARVRAVVATSTVSAPGAAGAPGVQTISVSGGGPNAPTRTVTASSVLPPSSAQTLTVADPLRNAAPSAQVAASGPAGTQAFASRSVRAVASPMSYQAEPLGGASGDGSAAGQPSVGPGEPAAPWTSPGPGGR